MAWLTQASPCMPIMPRLNSDDAGMTPMPSKVVVIGMPAVLASLSTSSVVPDLRMPWPARMSGRLAALISSAARANSDAGAW